MSRMNREEFFGKLAMLDEDQLRKAMWNLYLARFGDHARTN